MKTDALLVHAEFPVTYWGMQYGLPLAGKAASLPPLGLITLAAMLPDDWRLTLVDLNVEPLTDAHLAAADVALIGGMHVQAESMNDVVRRAHAVGVPAVVGGPAPSTSPDSFPAADVVFGGEAEGRVDDLRAAVDRARARLPGSAQEVLTAPQARPTLDLVPVPRFDLLRLERYASMAVQYSRGCPFTCEFCDIIEIFGRVPRVKEADGLLADLQGLLDAGWSGPVFVVDDNFIGNRKAASRMLPHLVAWQRRNGYPFNMTTEASLNLAQDSALVEAMVRAGFASVFLGIESPSAEALRDAHKMQNLRGDLSEAVALLSRAGLEVMGGFIVGFDSDSPEIFDLQRAFIADSPIPMAMVGLLTALPGTALWRRLEAEGRLRANASGDQFGRPNFEPSMDEETLLRGYSDLLAELYTADAWYDRCENYLDLSGPSPGRRPASWSDVPTVARTLWQVGVVSPRRRRFWRLVARSVAKSPQRFAWAIAKAIIGEHMIEYTSREVRPRMAEALEQLRRHQVASAA